MAKIIYAPNPLAPITSFSVFLAGSIEMGTAENWQTYVEKELFKVPVVIYNPRRYDWEPSWIQSMDNPQFKEQATWELDALERANLIAMYFDPKTKSPISLLEMGLFALSRKLVVCCPDGFWRKGNVDIVCVRYGILQVASLQELVEVIKIPAKIANDRST